MIEAFRGLNANILAQEFIKEAGGADVRCLVVGGKVVAAMLRQGKEGEFRSNLHRGGNASVVKITPEERSTAVRAAKVMGLNVAGVETTPIGWREWLAFPELGIPAIKAKIDTGARSSSLHTHDFEIYQSNGETQVRFHLHPLSQRDDIELECDTFVSSVRTVKDSGGHVENRPFITTLARLGDLEWPIEVSQTNRDSMKFRMLLGRTAMKGRFTVDPSRSYLAGKSPALS